MKSWCIVGLAVSTIAGAQQSPAPAKIPIRAIAPVQASEADILKNVAGVVEFADGRVLVNDGRAKRLLLFDRELTRYVVTADTMRIGKDAYPQTESLPITAQLYKYLGDSAAFTDITTSSFIIIGPDGRLGRTMAHPRPQEFGSAIISRAGRNHLFDAQGRFVYNGPANAPRGAPAKHPFDTAAVLRADFDARRVDTVGQLGMPVTRLNDMYTGANGKLASRRFVNPTPPAADEWTVISDGSIAIVRPGDYHIDWIYEDGTRAPTPKMQFDWRRMTDADKQAKIDTMKRWIDSINTHGAMRYDMVITRCGAAPRPETPEEHAMRCRDPIERSGKLDTAIAEIVFPPLDEMLDYVPAIKPYSVLSDCDNHVWILPTTTLGATGGGLLYDVVNKKGEIEERVQLPAGRRIVGFGPHGTIYMVVGDFNRGFTLEKTHVVR